MDQRRRHKEISAMVDERNDWVGVGRFSDSTGDGGHFLLVRIDRAMLTVLEGLISRAQNALGGGELSEQGVDYVDVQGTMECDYDTIPFIVLPFTEWKLIGKDACERMHKDEPTIVRFSEDHMQYLRLSSYKGAGRLEITVGMEYGDLMVHLRAQSYDEDYAEREDERGGG